MTLRLFILIIGTPFLLWVLITMFNEITFSRYFWKQKLHCWKCITFWTSLITSIIVMNEVLIPLCFASVLSFIADLLDNKINRNKNNEIKL